MEKHSVADAHWCLPDTPTTAKSRQDVVRTSRYLEMRDGVRIAIDLYLPANPRPDVKLPTILHQTRYYRRTSYFAPFGWLMARRDPVLRLFKTFVIRGYAVMNVDVRGTGASFGCRHSEWSPEEVRDGADIVDWIIEQPWSDGQVATWGISYTGTSAEKALINRHPAIKAAVIQYALLDAYADILCPGGVYNQGFMSLWAGLDAALDANQLRLFARHNMGLLAGLMVKGATPVDEDVTGTLLRQAVEEHRANYGIYDASLEAQFRGDRTNQGVTVDEMSPFPFLAEIEASGAAIYSWSGWYDGAYTLAAVKRFLALDMPETRLLLGPWDHGGWQNPDPFVKDHRCHFDYAGEALRFLDYHMKGIRNGIEAEPPVHYFTIGEEQWKTAETWPPPGFARVPYYFAPNGQLAAVAPVEDLSEGAGADQADVYQANYSATSGKGSRWYSQVNTSQRKIRYENRRQQDAKLVTWTSEPLAQDTEVTGTPLITLFIRSSDEDAQFFVYLEDVWPDGAVFYVTEGVFHALHRHLNATPPPYEGEVPSHPFTRASARPLTPGQITEVAFHLQPISYLFRQGHAIRLALAAADRDNFAIVPPSPPEIEILRSAAHPSHVVLPVDRK